MASTFMEKWTDELTRSDRLWERAGITSSDGRLGEESRKMVSAYNTTTWMDDLAGIPLEALREVPIIFNETKTARAQLYARHPIVDVFATDRETAGNARRMERFVNHTLRKRDLGIKRQWNRSLLAGLMLPGGGFLRHGFTPEEEVFDDAGKRIERYMPAKSNFPWMRSLPPWAIRIDPLAETFDPRGDVRWVAFLNLRTMDEIRRNPNMKARKDLRPTRTVDFGTGDGEVEVVESWVVFENMERTWFEISPKGSDKPLRTQEGWPIPWPTLPYNHLGFHENLDSPFPIPPARPLTHVAYEMNVLRTMMAEFVKRQRRIIAVAVDKLNDDDEARLFSGDGPDMMELLRFEGEGVGDAIKEVNAGGFDQTLIAWEGVLRQESRETMGQSLMDRGQRINVESASEAEGVKTGSELQRGVLAGPWEDFMSDSVATWATALQTPDVLTDEITIPVLGSADARDLFRGTEGELGFSPFDTSDPKEIRGEFLYEVRPGSTAPRDPAEEIQRRIAWLSVAKEHPQLVALDQAVLELAIDMDLDPTKALQSPEEIKAVQQGLQQNGPGPTGEQTGTGGGTSPDVFPSLNGSGGQ